jgi:hypothetical protein
VETTNWRARRRRTAQRVRREGTASAVPYPYPSGKFRRDGAMAIATDNTILKADMYDFA